MRETEVALSGPRADAEPHLDHLFSAVLQFRSESPADAVVPAEGRQGAYLGSGDGTVTGALRGTMRWTFYAENCLFPQIRRGEKVPDDLHLCTVNPGGFIETDDGARIAFHGRGYGLRSPQRYLVSMTLSFSTADARYSWLNKVLGLMDGSLDEKAGRAAWNVYVAER